MSGVVTDLEQGFLSTHVGTMAEITVDPGDRELGGRLYAFLRVADIRVEGVHLCTGLTDGRPPPRVGASVVLALDLPLDATRVLGQTAEGEPIVWPQPNEVLIAGALPKAYRDLVLDSRCAP